MPQHGVMARIPAVLDTADLPIAELCAARLDGELMAIDDGWVPVDEPDLPASRAALVALRAQRALIIERLSAAWVHGASTTAPAIAQFCVPQSSRIAVLNDRRASVREVQLHDGDVVDIGGHACTSVPRTAFDLLRDHSLGDPQAIEVVVALLHLGPDVSTIVGRRLDDAVRMPHRALARARLGAAEAAWGSGSTARAGQPSLTR